MVDHYPTKMSHILMGSDILNGIIPGPIFGKVYMYVYIYICRIVVNDVVSHSRCPRYFRHRASGSKTCIVNYGKIIEKNSYISLQHVSKQKPKTHSHNLTYLYTYIKSKTLIYMYIIIYNYRII